MSFPGQRPPGGRRKDEHCLCGRAFPPGPPSPPLPCHSRAPAPDPHSRALIWEVEFLHLESAGGAVTVLLPQWTQGSPAGQALGASRRPASPLWERCSGYEAQVSAVPPSWSAPQAIGLPLSAECPPPGHASPKQCPQRSRMEAHSAHCFPDVQGLS